jgi:hypothetical protein
MNITDDDMVKSLPGHALADLAVIQLDGHRGMRLAASSV